MDLSSATSALHAFNCNNAGGLDNITIKVTEKLTSATNFFAYPGEDSFHSVTFTEDSVIAFSPTMQRLTELNHDSICSVVQALSPDTDSLSLTLSQAAVDTAFETSAGAADGSTSEEWLALVATKTNWTISLA